MEPFVRDVAAFRLKYFKDFPYLYHGTDVYEAAYLQHFCQNPKAILVRVLGDSGELVGISTGLPLVTTSGIGDEALFTAAGHDPSTYFYYGEVILDHEFRGFGITKTVYALQ
ncbi:MAG: GNAT family N-acetyltransferase, partial [Proteobacteria bacterium]